MVWSWVSIYSIKTNWIKLYWSTDIHNFNFWEEGLGIVSSPHLVHYFSTKILFILYSINGPNITVSWPLLLKILCNLWRHRFWNYSYLSNQVVYLHDQKVETKIWISSGQKDFLNWNKKQFSSFLRAFKCQKWSQTL